MTPDRFKECLDAAGLPLGVLARLTGYTRSGARQWASGKAQVPPAIAAWLERRAADPAPRRPLQRWEQDIHDALDAAEAAGLILNKRAEDESPAMTAALNGDFS